MTVIWRLIVKCRAKKCGHQFEADLTKLKRFDDGDPEFPSHFYYVSCPKCGIAQVEVWNSYGRKADIVRLEAVLGGSIVFSFNVRPREHQRGDPEPIPHSTSEEGFVRPWVLPTMSA
ncbi:MAG: hypothetical protein AAB584_00250 [Patescibacteria group bacterium]